MRERRQREPNPVVELQGTESVTLEHAGTITRYLFTVDGVKTFHYTTIPNFNFYLGYKKVQSDRSLLTYPSIGRSVEKLGFANGEAFVASEAAKMAKALKQPGPYDYTPINIVASMTSRLIRSEALKLLFQEAYTQ